MRSALFLICLAGCYSPSFEDCEVLCTDKACPSGLECKLGVCRTSDGSGTCGASGDGGTGDRDGDRITDNEDNCPDAPNPDQFDEDGDGTGDTCDLCPIVSNLLLPGADDDSDGDMLGAACDPNPNLNTDRLLLFEPFNTPQPANAGPVGSAAWTFTNGQAVASVSAVAFGAYLFNVTTDDTRPYFVLTKVTLTSGSTASLGQDLVSGAGVQVLGSPDGSVGAGCSIGFTNAAPGLFAVNSDSNGDHMIGAVPENYSQGTAYEVGASRPASSVISCNGSGGASIPSASTPATAGVGSQIGIHTRAFAATFDYLFVVDTTAP